MLKKFSNIVFDSYKEYINFIANIYFKKFPQKNKH